MSGSFHRPRPLPAAPTAPASRALPRPRSGCSAGLGRAAALGGAEGGWGGSRSLRPQVRWELFFPSAAGATRPSPGAFARGLRGGGPPGVAGEGREPGPRDPRRGGSHVFPSPTASPARPGALAALGGEGGGGECSEAEAGCGRGALRGAELHTPPGHSWTPPQPLAGAASPRSGLRLLSAWLRPRGWGRAAELLQTWEGAVLPAPPAPRCPAIYFGFSSLLSRTHHRLQQRRLPARHPVFVCLKKK